MPLKKQLQIDLTELCIAREAETSDLTWFLDSQTGAVILLNEEYEPSKNAGIQPQEIEGNPRRFIPVEPQDKEARERELRAFCAQVVDAQLKESLELALTAPRPEKRVKALLQWVPEELNKWHHFRRNACETSARLWLSSLGIEIVQKAA